jgi:hypothetical protein
LAIAIVALGVLGSLGCNTGVVTHEQQDQKRKALNATIDPAVDGPHEKRPG